MPSRPIWQNGALVAWDDATVSVMSHAMQRGSLVFDVGAFRTTPRGRAAFRMRDHVVRFARSAGIIGLALPYDRDALEAATRETIRASGLDVGLVRWSAWFPSLEADLVPRAAAAHVAIAAYAPSDATPAGVAHKPKPSAYRIAIPKDVRKAGPEVFPPEAKVAAAYLGPMLAKRRAVAAGFDEIVLLDREGNVAEAPTCNVFAVMGGALVTPPLGRILDGITRDSVLAIARAEGIAAREEHVAVQALRTADEAFLTASSIPIGPIGSIDGVAMGSGEVGPVTRKLRDVFRAVEAGEDARFAAWLGLVDE